MKIVNIFLVITQYLIQNYNFYFINITINNFNVNEEKTLILHNKKKMLKYCNV